MLLTRRLTAITSVLCLAAALAVPAAAAPKPTLDPSQPSYIDLNKVVAAYRRTAAFQKYGVRIRDKGRSFAQEMELIAQMRYATPEERQEAMALKAKPKLAPAEQARFDELMKTADKVENELTALSQNPEPTDAERKRITELSNKRTEAVKALSKEDADRREQMRKFEAALLEEVENEMLTLVGKVAKDQKLGVIYERRAVLLGGNDLTEEVIKRLPK